MSEIARRERIDNLYVKNNTEEFFVHNIIEWMIFLIKDIDNFFCVSKKPEKKIKLLKFCRKKERENVFVVRTIRNDIEINFVNFRKSGEKKLHDIFIFI